MRSAHLEDSLFAHLRSELKSRGVQGDFPGEPFRPSGLDSWVVPRITAITRSELSFDGEEDETVTLQVECHVPTDKKGGRVLDLSTLVDLVREVVDASLGATAFDVRDPESGQVQGVLSFGVVSETRSYGGTVTSRGEQVPGVDSAVLTVDCDALGGTC